MSAVRPSSARFVFALGAALTVLAGLTGCGSASPGKPLPLPARPE